MISHANARGDSSPWTHFTERHKDIPNYHFNAAERKFSVGKRAARLLDPREERRWKSETELLEPEVQRSASARTKKGKKERGESPSKTDTLSAIVMIKERNVDPQGTRRKI